MLKKKMLATVMAILCCAQTNLALPCIADYVQVDVMPDETILANPEDASSVKKLVQELVEIRNVLETYIKAEKLSVEPMQIATWDVLEDKPIPVEEITLTVGCETEEVADQIKNFLKQKQIDTSHVFITWQMITFEEPIVPVDDLNEMKIMLSNYTLNHGLEAIVRMTETQVKIICQSQSAYDHMVALVEEKQLNQNREMVICVLELPVIDPDAELATDPTEESTTEPNPVLELTPIKKIEIRLGNYIRENGVAAHINITETQIEVACESQEIYDHMSAWVKEQKFNQEQNIVICTLADPINTDGWMQASEPDPVEPFTNPVLELTPIKKVEIRLGNYIRENGIAAHMNITETQIEVACESQEIYDHMSAWVKEQKFNEEKNVAVVCTLFEPVYPDDLMPETELPSDFDVEKYNSVVGGLNRYIKKNNISAYAGGDDNLRLEQVKVVCKTEEAYRQMLAFIEQEKYNQDDDIVICILSKPVYSDDIDIMPVTEFPPDFDEEKHSSIMGELNGYIRENNISGYACGDTNLRLEQVKVVCRTEEAYQQMQAFIEEQNYNQDDDIVVLVMRKESTETAHPLEDDVTDIRDVVVVTRAVLGKETLTDTQQEIADVNHNGIVDPMDSLMIMNYVVGLIEEF
ncbi:MAG: dockerin type I repeat-containing protein [Oscillospiraceae bacterium]|nr:dockerin type I repeat-containing protein [Oscillospiraceae bacterium]